MTYKVYEKIQANVFLRMVTDNKQMAEKYTKNAKRQFKTVWMKKEKEA